MGPKERRSAVLSPMEEAAIVALIFLAMSVDIGSSRLC